jgi:iron uptake system component EfeO
VSTVLVLGAVTACVAGCGGGGAVAAPVTGDIGITATDTSCTASQPQATAGTITFEVANQGSKVTEFYLLGDGDKVVGEVEDIGPGLSRKLVVRIPRAGTFTMTCKPGMAGDGISGPFVVTGSAGPAGETVTAAVEDYKTYLVGQSETLGARTGEFVTAVKTGKLDDAKALYPIAHTFYERIEPVAESLGDLDGKVDVRESDLDPGQAFTGFHRLERDLWKTGVQPDTAAVADQLNADVQQVIATAKTIDLTGPQLASGAKELLDEVAGSKITGEEEAYSHTDLWDFRANVDGARAVVTSVRPIVVKRDPQLAATVDTRFAAVDQLLGGYQRGDGFVLFPALSADQVTRLSTAVGALSEPLARVAAVVAAQ